MAMSMGQEKGQGHSAGAMGHGGHISAHLPVAYKGPGNNHSHMSHSFQKGSHSHSDGGNLPEGGLTHMPGHGGEFAMGCG